MTDLENVLSRLRENGIRHVECAVGEKHAFIVPVYGAHLLGPFDRDGSGESVFWLSDLFANPAAFNEAIARKEWNLGGVRLWIAPEIQFGVRDRTKYWETLYVQPDMEPGNYRFAIDAAGHHVMAQEMELECHNTATGTMSLNLRRTVRPVADPLRFVPGFERSGLDYFGFAHDATLAVTTAATSGAAAAEVWNLVQVKSGGKAVIPTTGAFSHADYYEPIEESHLQVDSGRAVLNLDGKRRFKIGVRSHCHYGRVGYLRDIGEEAELILCSHYNDPANHYSEQPDRDPRCNGMSMHFYNDGGMFGGFSELEANGRNAGDPGACGHIEDSFSVWRWRGNKEKVQAAAGVFGVRMD